MTPKSQNSGVREASQRCQLLCNSLLKHVSMAMNTDTTEEEFWGQCFPISLQQQPVRLGPTAVKQETGRDSITGGCNQAMNM
jgi:hypothetical protein